MLNAQTIVVLAPHTDDGELGAGASIARWTREGRDVHYVGFSACQSSIPEGWPEDVLVREMQRATAMLGVPPERARVLPFEVRHFAAERQPILQTMVELNRELRPDLVLMPSVHDLHQDHNTIAVEARRAFKFTSVLSYEIAWNNIEFRTESFVHVQQEDVDAKLAALSCYESQGHRPYMDPAFQRSQLMFRGAQAGATFAEAFEVVRWIVP